LQCDISGCRGPLSARPPAAWRPCSARNPARTWLRP
jgi:hypothetical protein